MKVNFVRFKATDDVELQGWLSKEKSDIAAIHIHGKSGNGYENYFLDNLREMYSKNDISFFTIDTRGRGIISTFWQNGKSVLLGKEIKLGGSCFEIFEESMFDIQGAIDYLKGIGKKKFILQGHSLGSTKVVNYLVRKTHSEVIFSILLAPTDMTGWANKNPKNKSNIKKAKELISRGVGEELIGAQIGLDKSPMSAQSYLTMHEAGTAVDIYGGRKGGALLSRIDTPTLIVYGDHDIGIIEIDENINKWLERVNKIKNKNTQISIIKDSPHSFKGYEKDLSQIISSFLSSTSS